MNNITKTQTSLLSKCILVLATLCITALRAEAHQAAPPPLEGKTIIGTWEAVNADRLRLYVLKIGGTKPSEVNLVVIAGPGENLVASVYHADAFRLDKSGRLVVTASGKRGGDRWFAEVDAVGTGYGEEGTMEGKVRTWRNNDEKSASTFKVLFTKSSEGLTQWLVRARAKATEFLGEQK